MLLQSLGSMIVCIDALRQFVPDVFFDTTGLAFTYPVVKVLAGSKVLSYTHYPTISTDMLRRVREKRTTYNNDAFISQSTTISTLKLLLALSHHFINRYYKAFSILYGIVGRSVDRVMVNGTWTYNHIIQQWREPASRPFFCLLTLRNRYCVSSLRHDGTSTIGIEPNSTTHDSVGGAVQAREGPCETTVHPAETSGHW